MKTASILQFKLIAEIPAYRKACVYPSVSNLESFTFFDIVN
jgi:hypothetical protein